MQATEQGAQQTCNSRDIKPPPQMGKTSSGNSKAQARRKVKAMAGESAARLRMAPIARAMPGEKSKGRHGSLRGGKGGKNRGDISRETYAWGLRARSNSCWIWALGTGVSRETTRITRQLRTKAGKSS